MEKFDWTSIVNGYDSDRIKRIIEILENRGFITEMDEHLGSMVFKQGIHQLSERISLEGYESGPLLSYSHFYPEFGQVYSLFDSDRFYLRNFKDVLHAYMRPIIESYKQ